MIPSWGPFIFYEVGGGGGGGGDGGGGGGMGGQPKKWCVRGGMSPKIITVECCNDCMYNSAKIPTECLKLGFLRFRKI